MIRATTFHGTPGENVRRWLQRLELATEPILRLYEPTARPAVRLIVLNDHIDGQARDFFDSLDPAVQDEYDAVTAALSAHFPPVRSMTAGPAAKRGNTEARGSSAVCWRDEGHNPVDSDGLDEQIQPGVDADRARLRRTASTTLTAAQEMEQVHSGILAVLDKMMETMQMMQATMRPGSGVPCQGPRLQPPGDCPSPPPQGHIDVIHRGGRRCRHDTGRRGQQGTAPFGRPIAR